MFTSRIKVRPAIRCSRCSPLPTPSSGLPLLSGLCFDGRLPRINFTKVSNFGKVKAYIFDFLICCMSNNYYKIEKTLQFSFR